jgi:hypothetical protein
LLNTTDDLIKQEIINVIAETNFIDAVDELTNILPKSSPDIQKEICTVFGNLHIVKTVPILIKLLKSGPGLFGLVRGIDPEVRIRACWALTNFTEIKEAKDAIMQAAKDSHTALRTFARDILKTI